MASKQLGSRRNISRSDAKARLREKAKSPNRDKGRLAKTVAPAKAKTPEDFRLQRRWFTSPTSLDFEGVDTPGTRKEYPDRAKRAREVVEDESFHDQALAVEDDAQQDETPEPLLSQPSVSTAETFPEVRKRIVIPQIAPLAGMTPLGVREPQVEAAAELGSAVKVGFSWEAPARSGIGGGSGTTTKTITEIRGNRAMVQSKDESFPKIVNITQLEQDIDFDRRSLESKARQVEKQRVDDEAKAAPLKRLTPFLETLTPMEAGRADKVLQSPAKVRGDVDDRFKHIERFVDDGWSIEDHKVLGRMLVSPTGTFLVEKDLTKIGLDYAKFLTNQPVAEVVESTPEETEVLFKRTVEALKEPTIRKAQEKFEELTELAEAEQSSGTAYDDTYTGPRWTYGLTYRDVGAGTPKGWVIFSDKKADGFTFGTIDYPRELTQHEVEAFQLTPVAGEAESPTLALGELASIGAQARKDLEFRGVADAKDIQVKVVGNNNDKFEVEMIAHHEGMTGKQRHTMPGEYDTLDEAREGALKELTSALIEQESLAAREEAIEHDDTLQPTERPGITEASIDILEGVQAPILQADEEIRGVGRGLVDEGRSDEEVRKEFDGQRHLRESSVVLGDTGVDIGDPARLEQEEPLELVSKTLEQPAVPLGRDYVLSVGELEQTDKSPALRFDANLDAIRILKQLEETNQKATPEQQKALAKYSGFGDSAFNSAFSSTRGYGRDDAWKERGRLLEELVTGEEYQAIEKSRLNAFYTTPAIVKSMWDGLEHLGANNLAHPRVLEPSAGSGRFLGLQPVDMAAKSQRTAVELDKITGAVLSQLYQNVDTHVMGFQEAPIANDSIDLAISNVPFGDLRVTDKDFKGRKHLTQRIHNYFFAKTLDKLRPGGVMAFITSHGTMDASSNDSRQIRESLAEQGDLVGAIRLPKGAFPDTQVVTDIIFMKKRLPGEEPGDSSWLDTAELTFTKTLLDSQGNPRTDWRGDPYPDQIIKHSVNQYFIDHPEMVLGTHSANGSMRRENEYSVDMTPGSDLAADIKAAVSTLPDNVIVDAPRVSEDEIRRQRKPSPRNVRNNSYVLDESGELFVKKGNDLEKAGLTNAQETTVLAMLGVRDAARAVLKAQMNDEPDATVKAAQAELNKQYDAFAAKNGELNSKANTKLMGNDPDAPLLRALENLNPDTKKWEKMPVFSKRVIKGLGEHQASTPVDAMAIVLNESGFLDFDRMSAIMGDTTDNIRAELSKERVIYKDPMGTWQEADKYLSGNVREKLADAERAARKDPAFLTNVEALKPVIPADLPPSEIYVQLGVPWVPQKDINDFTNELLGIYSYRMRQSPPIFSYNETTGEWYQDVQGGKVDANRSRMEVEYGTPDMSGLTIISRLLQGKKIEVNDSIEVDGKRKSVRNEKASVAAQEKASLIQEKFTEWLWSSPERADRLARYYNDHFNNIAPRQYNGAHQTFPGMSLKWAGQLHEHQRDAVWRTVEDGTTLLAHEVGFGKTAVMVAAGMELRRLGLSRKNVFVVPKATHAQFAKQFEEIYPYAKVLYPDKQDFTKANRPEFVSRMATGDWDAVIITGEQFKALPISPETQARFMQEEMNDLRAALEATKNDRGESKAHKDIQKLLSNAAEKMLELNAKIKDKADDTLYFEDLGIDQIFVDEADMYKNLRFTTSMGSIKGLPNSKSDRSWDMYQKVRHLQKKGNGRGVVFATGTPVANSVAELWTMMRYLQPGMLEDNGIDKFDAWAKTFGGTTEALEQTAQGTYRMTQRFAKFNNIPELSALWQQAADIRVTSEVPEITRLQPRLVNEEGKAARTVVAAPITDELKAYMNDLADRAGNLGNVDPRDDNMLKISSDARKASLDMRLVNPKASDNPNSKAGAAVNKIAEIYKKTDSEKGTQLLFLDISTPKAKNEKKGVVDEEDDLINADDELTGEEQAVLDSVYQDIKRKLSAKGIPEGEIAFIHDAKTDAQRNTLFTKVNNGDIRVMIGSTGKMGVGVNVQERIAALHHLDAPWRPRDIEQREGRAIRQGNKAYGPKLDDEGTILDPGKGVGIYNYVTEGSFDAYMWQAIEAKAKAIKALLRRQVTLRSIDDADDFVLSASEAKALASGNPDVMKAVQLKNDIRRLQMVRASHNDQQLRIKQSVDNLPLVISGGEARITALNEDTRHAEQNSKWDVKIGKKTFDEKEKDAANTALIEMVKQIPLSNKSVVLGTINGFKVQANHEYDGFRLILTADNPGAKHLEHITSPIPEENMDASKADLVTRALNKVKLLPSVLANMEHEVQKHRDDLASYTTQANKPFERNEQLERWQEELTFLEKKLQNLPEEEVQSTETVGAFSVR